MIITNTKIKEEGVKNKKNMNEIIKNLEKAMLNASDERRSQLINLVHKLKTNK